VIPGALPGVIRLPLDCRSGHRKYSTSARSKQATAGSFRRAWGGLGGGKGRSGRHGGGACKLQCGENVWGGVNNISSARRTGKPRVKARSRPHAQQLLAVLLLQSD